ncbi:hypothetical protein SLS64_010891 [Diaporthe eres]|uniref:Protein kinase domain-containing protein n=1 Tax=Diaporthe eres TaxID=83184 RepID=A0ABR1P6P7_DIAER
MTNNNNDDNDDDDSRKRKERPYLPADDVQNGPNKRLNLHRTPNTPVMGPVQPTNPPVTGPPAQPEPGVGNPQMDSPTVYVSQQTTRAPFVAMSNTDVAPQQLRSQSQSQPQAQYTQQQPQHVTQPVEHRPGLDTNLAPGFSDIEHADGQQQMTHQESVNPQRAGRSVQYGQEGSSTGMLRNQAIEAYSLVSGGIPIEISATGRPGKGHFTTDIPKSETTISMCSGDEGRKTIQAQYAYHRNHYGRFGDVQYMLHRHQWDTGHRLAYPDLVALTDDELLMFFRSLVAKRVRKVPIRTKLVCWIDVLREAVRRFHDTDIITSLGNMSPWTKTFSIQQYILVDGQAKPWEFYDYAAGITLSLPAGPVEQAQGAWEDFVAKGIPGFPAQVFADSDRN